MIEAVQIERMSLKDRLRTMELLWHSMAGEPDKLKSPAWHGKVLSQRLARIESGKAEFLTISQLKKRLAGKRTV